MPVHIFLVGGYSTNERTYALLNFPAGTDYFFYEPTVDLKVVYRDLVARIRLADSTTVFIGHSMGANLLLQAVIEHHFSQRCLFLMPFLPQKPIFPYMSGLRWLSNYVPVPSCLIAPRFLLSSSESIWQSFTWSEWRLKYIHQLADASTFVIPTLKRGNLHFVIGRYDYMAPFPTSTELTLRHEQLASVTVLPLFHEGWRDSTEARNVLKSLIQSIVNA